MSNKYVSYMLPYLIPFVIDAVKDAISPEDVIDFRDDIIKLLEGLADKTETSIDDTVVDFLVEAALSLDHYAEYGKKLLSYVLAYVKHSDTKYDDYCIPFIEYLMEIFDKLETEES